MDNYTIVSSSKDIDNPKQKTLPEYILAQAKHFAEIGRSAFLIDGISDEKRYFKSLEEQTRKVASHFYKKGLRKGEIVIYTTSQQIHQVVLMIGVWRANGVMRSLYSDEALDTTLLKLKESKARWIFCDAENASDYQKIADQTSWPVEVVVCGKPQADFVSFDEYLNDDGLCCPELQITEHDLAVILPTSGTTGSSKGAMHTHYTAIQHLIRLNRLPFTYPKNNLIASKGTHVSGTIIPLSMITSGRTGIVLPKVNKDIVIQTVDLYKPGLAFAFPSFLLALGSEDAKGYDVSSVEVMLTGGSCITLEMKKAYMALPNMKFVVNAYGLTEGMLVATTADISENRSQLFHIDIPDSSVGKPYPGTQIQIRDIDTLEVLGPNQRGEVCAKGEFLFTGYFLNPESTKDAFVDGWFRTGDIGYANENGDIFIVDRAKDIFKYFNNHISPTELEDVISQHPLVDESCVVAVPHEGGEVPRAFVVLTKKEKEKNLVLLAEEIKKFADDKLASYKQLRGGLYIIDELPKGKTGKVTRRLVAELEV